MLNIGRKNSTSNITYTTEKTEQKIVEVNPNPPSVPHFPLSKKEAQKKRLENLERRLTLRPQAEGDAMPEASADALAPHPLYTTLKKCEHALEMIKKIPDEKTQAKQEFLTRLEESFNKISLKKDALPADMQRHIERLSTWIGEQLERYGGAFTEKNVYSFKQLSVEGGLEYIKELIAREKDSKQQTNLKTLSNLNNIQTFLENRKKGLSKKTSEIRVDDPKKILGKHKLSGVRHPLDARAQKAALDQAVKNITMTGKDAKIPLETALFTEDLLMEALFQKLDKGEKHVRERFLEHKATAANARTSAWDEVSDTIHVPMEGGKTDQVTNTITPVGAHARKEGGIFEALAEGSTLTKAWFKKSYGEKGGQRGTCCFFITCFKNAVNLATSTLSLGSGKVYTFTRHGVASAYGIVLKHLKTMRPEKLQEMISTLLLVGEPHLPLGKETQEAFVTLLTEDPQYLKAFIKTVEEDRSKENAIKLLLAALKQQNTSKQPSPTTPDDLKKNLFSRFGREGKIKRETLANALLLECRKEGTLPQDNTLLQLFSKALQQNIDTPIADLMRRQASENRMRENITTAIAANIDLVRRRLAEGKPIDIDSLSLLTPDKIRGGVSTDEERMLQDQVQAIKDCMASLKDETFKIVITDSPDGNGDISKKIRISAMNFGVNQGAVGTLGALSTVSGWAMADRLNQTALTTLFGTLEGDSAFQGGAIQTQITQLQTKWQEIASGKDGETLPAEKKISGIEAPDKKKQIADIAKKINALQQLRTQITDLYTSGEYREEGFSAYKMVRLIAALCVLSDRILLWNCKSGKDRTGALDAEVKFILWHLDQFGTFPSGTKEYTDLEKAQLTAFYESNPNFDMQRFNTGAGGYKLAGVPSLVKQLGKEIYKQIRGLSQYVKA